mgnify:CR=1 FL=1|tara:strand:- start:4403 stop:5164 length:762 start_codon:yes stop_codon:yes gene_type:complete
MKRIVLFGTGNLATHLFEAYKDSLNFKIVQVFNHDLKSLKKFKSEIATTTNLSEIIQADIYLLALKDDVLEDFSKKITDSGALVVHTSGAVRMNVLQNFGRSGVFYPLQTFSKSKEVEFTTIPICVEANSASDKEVIFKMASEISTKVFEISSEQRKSLHVAAVFVSNFVNLLYTEGEIICKQNNVPFKILHPLIQETAGKILNISPREAQTGPAKRKDQQVITAHLGMLSEEQKEIYSLLTKSIQNLHGEEL